MFHRESFNYSVEVKRRADEIVMHDIADRAFWLSTICLFASIAYGFTSTEFIQKFDSSVTIWSNVYPRLIFNSLPCFLFMLFLGLNKQNGTKKVAMFCFLFFSIFMGACFVYVWPIMWSGKPEIYYFVHSANIFIITIFLLVLSPPPILSVLSIFSYMTFIMIPVITIFSHLDQSAMIKWVIGDIFLSTTISGLFAHNIYLLRRKLARIQVYNQDRTKTYLGEKVANAILNREEDQLTGKKVSGFILAIDLRGYSNFKKSASPEIYHQFMNAYHSNVSQTIGRYGGYIHKTNGDGHLISFGVMNAPEDLTDIPGIESEVAGADQKRNKTEFSNVNSAIHDIQNEFFKLKNDFLINENLRVGSAISFGELVMVRRGHESHKMEFDIDGEAIMRAARLEQYTKTLATHISIEEGFCIYAPEVSPLLDKASHTHKWEITDGVEPVPDNPHIKTLIYKSFTNAFVEKYLAS